MQTPLNSSETKAVISETLERNPSFFPPLVTKQPRRTILLKTTYHKTGQKGEKKVIINQLGSQKKKKISLFLSSLFSNGKVFSFPRTP